MRLIESIYLQRMRSTGDIQFFVRRSRIIPEPPFPSQGIAGLGNEIVETRRRVTVATFYVAKTADGGNLISVTTAQDLGLVSLHLDKLSETNDKKLDSIINKHSNVFNGLGRLQGETVKLNIDKNQTPRAQRQRRIPYHIRDKVQTGETALKQFIAGEIKRL